MLASTFVATSRLRESEDIKLSSLPRPGFLPPEFWEARGTVDLCSILKEETKLQLARRGQQKEILDYYNVLLCDELVDVVEGGSQELRYLDTQDWLFVSLGSELSWTHRAGIHEVSKGEVVFCWGLRATDCHAAKM